MAIVAKVALRQSLRLVLTAGDPVGIGAELIWKVLAHVAAGTRGPARALKQALTTNALELNVMGLASAFAQTLTTLPQFRQQARITASHLVMKKLAVPFTACPAAAADKTPLLLGKPSALTGQAALAALKHGCELIETGKADALVTAPLSKASVAASAPQFVGHTEYLADYFKTTRLATAKQGFPGYMPARTHRQTGGLLAPQLSMGFMAPQFNLVLMTRHLALRAVSRALTHTAIRLALCHAAFLAALTTTRQKLQRIAVLALNPHGGEGGLFGTEEERLTTVMQTLRTQPPTWPALPPLAWDGPLAADTAFMQVGRKRRYQHVVACYHDQGLIPLKWSAAGQAVQVTLGLPFIRTSPAHGTAFDIAGSNSADPTSLLAAVEAAWRLSKRYRLLTRRYQHTTNDNK